ncbi:hypothetical protein JKP88DRAFT_305762 [Tribonema minus]|uniref:Uncharacterized protein n=1 Tax=Tribonema minus TaxID=303371 RepID=A0A835ZFB4_9STRA|nr:hypothetical protein JKP88DRAFT_305762 [Tribonema minus]
MVVPQPSVIADGGSLQHQFATKLRQVALDAGPAGVLLSKLPSLVTIADRKLNNSECQLFGCDSLKSFIDSQPMLRRTGTSGLMRCIHKSYDSVIAAHRDGKPAFESRTTGLTAAGAAAAAPLPEPMQLFVPADADTDDSINEESRATHLTPVWGHHPSAPILDALTSPRALSPQQQQQRPGGPARHAPLFTQRLLLEHGAAPLRWGLLGTLGGSSGGAADALYLNTHDPFLMVVVGARGSGAAHATGAVAEACLLPCAHVAALPAPMAALVLHRGGGSGAACALAGLARPDARAAPLTGGLAVERVAVLVSPEAYWQRVRAYARDERARVFPLLFDWRALSAGHVRALLRLGDGGGGGGAAAAAPRCTHALTELLRRCQRADAKPEYEDFKEEALRQCSGVDEAQAAWLSARLALLDSVVWQSERNRASYAGEYQGLPALVIEVLLDQFRCLPVPSKLVILDEAHHYLAPPAAAASSSGGGGGLEAALLSACDAMHRQGLRIVVCAESPDALPPRLLARAHVAAVHRCDAPPHALRALRDALGGGLRESALEDEVRALPPGHALVYARGTDIAVEEGGEEAPWYRVRVRGRLTLDSSEGVQCGGSDGGCAEGGGDGDGSPAFA